MYANENNELFNDIDVDLNHFNEIYPDLNDANINQYYDSKSFNDLNLNKNDFRLFHHNIRSLNKNLDQLSALLSTLNSKFDILCFTECWLHESNEKLIHFENYDPKVFEEEVSAFLFQTK